jgi:hypothetical protein
MPSIGSNIVAYANWNRNKTDGAVTVIRPNNDVVTIPNDAPDLVDPRNRANRIPGVHTWL